MAWTMSRGMIYATVYQMMAEPDDYIGKTIRMDGLYSNNVYLQKRKSGVKYKSI